MKSIYLLKNRKSLKNIIKKFEDEMDDIEENIKNIKIIRSDKSGVGKSTHIKLEIQQNESAFVKDVI